MENLEMNWKSDKFVIFSGILGAAGLLAMFIFMILTGFSGYMLLWMLVSAGIAATAYFTMNKTLTKYVAGLAFLALPAGGAVINLLINSMGFVILMQVLLFVTIIGLFGYFYIEKDPLIEKVTALAAGLFVLCHLLPFGYDNSLPLQAIFKASFINAVLQLALFLGALAVAIFALFEMLDAKLPVETELVYRIAFYVLAICVIVIFLMGLFQSNSFKGFIYTLMLSVFQWSMGIVAGLSFWVMKEGQENKILPVNFHF